ncbi:endolytic transglycosylase MltG [Chthonobacter rhizosphaerae]|uniref:endolytic transglycosylase MltG n=1 Tax=Chthonobacter rhizosphaerae TaxID=2735553 RepID=UPI0015EFCC5F|nr:endolytic transglycosylase MltG [Chthonobacter rhizosphaerae]
MDDTSHNAPVGDRPEPPQSPSRINPKSPREAITPELAPAPPLRSERVRNPLVVALNALLTILVLAALGIGGVLYWGKSEFDAKGPLTTEKAVLVPSGSGLQAIADTLEREGVIADRYVFMGGITAYRQTARLKAGEYAFAPGVSMREVMDLLVSGKAILHTVTVPEGLTSRQIVNRLREHPMLTGEVDEIPAEGTLLPETYKFSRGTTRKQILAQMQAAHERAVRDIWANRNKDIPIETPQQLVTLASIVEKETGRADERPRVASVFINRLRSNMRLQSDPTIIYGIVGGEGTLGRPIRRSDIDARTAYNTYQINGLPPGPIANPGRAALEAVATPSTTKDLYFVADGTGGHVFAGSLAEHNRNVAAWRAIERQRAATGAVDQREPDATAPTEAAVEEAEGDPLDLLEGAPKRDPGTPVLPTPRPET